MCQYIASLFILFISCASIIGAEKFRCDYQYDSQARGWFKLHIIPANWHEAQLRCYLEGAVLASPLNAKIRESMQTIIRNNSLDCGIFTGIHATFSRGDFFSVEGIPFHKIPHTWAKTEPDNINDEESCIAMLPDANVADVNCRDPHSYICYKRETQNMTWNEACGTYDLGYSYDARTGHCYKFHRVPRPWNRAYMACAAEGGSLAITNSDTEATVLRELMAKNPGNTMVGYFNKDYISMGFHDWFEHGDWRTIESQTLTQAGYDKFASGQPDNATTGEFCGANFRSALLDDLWCDSPYGFICEKTPDSLCPGNNVIKDYDF